MATTQPTTDTGGTQEKTVTVIAYAANDAFDSRRDMADSLDGDRDYYERDYQTSRSVEIVHTDDDGNEVAEKVYTDAIRDALVDHGVADDDLTVREETTASRPYAHDPNKIASDLRKQICGDLPDKLGGGVSHGLWNYKWQDDNRQTKVYVRSDGVDYRRVLAHHTERDGRRKYDGRRKHLSAKFRIELGPEDPDVIDDWSDSVVAEFIKALARTGWVRKVRMADCVETVERDGDCFDI